MKYAFQYYTSKGMVDDQEGLTLSKAVSLARACEASFTRRIERNDKEACMAIWEGGDKNPYAKPLWSLYADECSFRGGILMRHSPAFEISITQPKHLQL
jgi:hypothetical protein